MLNGVASRRDRIAPRAAARPAWAPQIGPQCNAVVQREALSLARDYVRHAPDGRPPATAVTVVQCGREPEAFRAHFPWWLAWPPTAGDAAPDGGAAGGGGPAGRAAARRRAAGGRGWLGLTPSVLRQVRVLAGRGKQRVGCWIEGGLRGG